jgi:hypothetical protein
MNDKGGNCWTMVVIDVKGVVHVIVMMMKSHLLQLNTWMLLRRFVQEAMNPARTLP